MSNLKKKCGNVTLYLVQFDKYMFSSYLKVIKDHRIGI